MPKVSVIIPVYNTEKYLSKCLESLISQTLQDLEIICVNDGSTDNSLELLKSYAQQDKRIKIINFKENQGVSRARNAGIQAAIGEYIGFADSDDTVDLDFYEKLYNKAKDTNADIAKGDLKEIFPNGKIILYPQNEAILKYQNKFCFYLSFTSAIYRLDLIKANKIFFNHRLVHTEDLVWLNQVISNSNKVEIVPDAYYNYLRRDDSTDTMTLTDRNAASAYIGIKHIFLNTLLSSKSSNLDFSLCFKNYWYEIVSFIFRSPNLLCRTLFCKLLFFFYHHFPDFYLNDLILNNPSFIPYFRENKLQEFVDFMKDKNSFMKLTLANLRYNVKQHLLSSPKISIIIPVYNVEKYLLKCLDSVCHQTYQNLEIICVDDCSTDNSFSILNDCASRDARIHVIQRSENGGQAAARQTGIDAATGKYIGFIDSDDWVDEDYFEKMLQKAEQDKTDIVINENILVHEGEKIYPKNFPGHKQLEHKIYNNPSQLIDKFFCVVWNKLFRTDFLKQRKYTIPLRSAHEDVFFHYATFAFARTVSFFDGSSYHYLFREESISNLKHDWGVEHIKVYSQIYDFYKENNLLDKEIRLYNTMPFFIVKSEDMFDEYKKYFSKLIDYMNKNNELFSPLDLFFVNSVCECQNYAEYTSKYSANPMISFLRRKK